MSKQLTIELPLSADRRVLIDYPADLTPDEVTFIRSVLALMPIGRAERSAAPCCGGDYDEDAP